ncbi:MAG: CarD family transcriptional regulator [Clostridiales Family XIII bacterium]|jgi:CarD family transcriptional regulator|nr:CarD family transcriptional regulator [Clostridiales Family XIII bacterium]
MFSIGDKIVYPMHGAGIIEGIEEKLILGETRRYYVLHVPYGEMKIMIPCDSTDSVGVRGVIDETDLMDIEDALRCASTQMSDNWNRRYRDNMEKLKTGELIEVCEVVRNLMRVDRIKKLSTGEKKLLSNAKQILLSELILVSGAKAEEVLRKIDEWVFFEGA